MSTSFRSNRKDTRASALRPRLIVDDICGALKSCSLLNKMITQPDLATEKAEKGGREGGGGFLGVRGAGGPRPIREGGKGGNTGKNDPNSMRTVLR